MELCSLFGRKLDLINIRFIVDIDISFCFSEALTILSVHQAKNVKPTATKYILQLADMKLHICTYIQVENAFVT